MKRKILYCVMVLAGALCACSGINKVSEAKDRQMIYGDVNEDGSVSAKDALAVLRHAAQLENLQEGLPAQLADLDGNGQITAADARDILRTAAKLLPQRVYAEASEENVPTGEWIQGNILDGTEGQIHYSYYLPEGYDRTKKYPMIITLPGYGGMWFGEDSEGNNLRETGVSIWTEEQEPIIVVSPQVTDWQDTSARQTIELTEYFIENYAVDTRRVYGAGYSAGGETMSRVMGMRPELFAAYLHGSSQWDGAFAPAAQSNTAVYIFMAEHDEYYGSQKAQDAYDGLLAAYQDTGKSPEETQSYLQLWIPEDAYFQSRGITNYHGGGTILFEDASVRAWLLSKSREPEDAIPKELKVIPEAYYSPAERQGTLVDLYYDTYESFSYAEKTQSMQKHAVVYLPEGYDKTQKYNIFYLMHGGWGNENQTLGTPERPSGFKNVIDNAIANGDFEPLIIVCPTYNNTSPEDSASFSLALQLNRNYHNELVNDLIPAVEGTYSTYAQDTTPEALQASRDHRGFGGFSMGSVATWRTFQNCLDYFHYFLPMSCGTTLDDETIFEAAKGREQSDYFVWVMTGTNDFAYSYENNRVEKMRGSDYFTEANTEQDGNFAYRVKEGYDHGGIASMEYTYNGLCWFWKNRQADQTSKVTYSADTKISDVIQDLVFGTYGRLIFPVDTGYYSGDTLESLRLTWYTHIDPDKTVEICNYLREHAAAGEPVFYDIYTEEEKKADPDKRDTGLFFFKGNPGSKFAICNAGGEFAYVGAMHDSFPHALELSKMGYNAFALIYRPGERTACEDLARAISFIFANADALGVDTEGYSLWGGSAGARMAANLGTNGPAYYGGEDLPRPGTVVMQYTGHSTYSQNDPPTYVCVGDSDGIANWRTMERRIQMLQTLGIPTEFHVYKGLGHGFGLGTGTVAEGWINDAVAFWEKQ